MNLHLLGVQKRLERRQKLIGDQDKGGSKRVKSYAKSSLTFHWEIKGRFSKRVVLANVPSFRFSFRGNIRRNHPFGNHPFVNTKKGHWEIKGRFPKGWFWRTYPRSGFRSGGTSAKTTLLETTLLRTPEHCEFLIKSMHMSNFKHMLSPQNNSSIGTRSQWAQSTYIICMHAACILPTKTSSFVNFCKNGVPCGVDGRERLKHQKRHGMMVNEWPEQPFNFSNLPEIAFY